MNVSYCRQSQRRRFVSLNTTINIDFNHITLSRAPLMLCRFFVYSFLFLVAYIRTANICSAFDIFYSGCLISRIDLFAWSCQCHPNMPARNRFRSPRKKKPTLSMWRSPQVIRETDLVDFVYFEEMTMSLWHDCCYFDCRSRLRRSVVVVAALDILLVHTREKPKKKCLIKTKIVILSIRSLAQQRRSPFCTQFIFKSVRKRIA